MKDEISTLITNQKNEHDYSTSETETLSVFLGKSRDDKRARKLFEKAEDKANKKKVAEKGNAEMKATKQAMADKVTEELEKLNIVQQVFDELMKTYDFISVNDKLYVYSEAGGYWMLITDSDCQRELRRRVDRKWRGRVTKANLQEIYEWLVLDARHKDESVFREGRHHINFSDVAYNWAKDETTKDRKDLYFRYALSVPYPKGKSNGNWDAFVADVFGDDQDTLKAFRSFVGLALSDVRTLKYAFVLLGPSNTGKTVVMNLLKSLVGVENCASVSFSQMSSEFHTAQLHGKRLNLSGEVSGTTTNRLDVFKSLCGNDEVLVSNKMKDPFSFTNRCLLVFAANCLPKIVDAREVQSFVSRLIILPFRNVKPREEWDKKILEHLLDDYGSVINFAIKGLKDLEENGFTIPESAAMLECKRQYAGSYDSFTLFAQQYIERAVDNRVSSAEINKAYRHFCLIRDYEPLSENVWPQLLKGLFACQPKTMVDKSGERERRIRCYQGIRLKEDVAKLLEKPAPEVGMQQIFSQNG